MTYEKQITFEQTDNNKHAYIPEPEYTKGQPAPIVANNGLSYMSFDSNGDGGSTVATLVALNQIRETKNKTSDSNLEAGSDGGILTKWGVGFKEYEECVAYINKAEFDVPEGGVALPLRYSINEHPSYSIVPSNALWRDPARALDAETLRKKKRK